MSIHNDISLTSLSYEAVKTLGSENPTLKEIASHIKFMESHSKVKLQMQQYINERILKYASMSHTDPKMNEMLVKLLDKKVKELKEETKNWAAMCSYFCALFNKEKREEIFAKYQEIAKMEILQQNLQKNNNLKKTCSPFCTVLAIDENILNLSINSEFKSDDQKRVKEQQQVSILETFKEEEDVQKDMPFHIDEQQVSDKNKLKKIEKQQKLSSAENIREKLLQIIQEPANLNEPQVSKNEEKNEHSETNILSSQWHQSSVIEDYDDMVMIDDKEWSFNPH